MTPSSPGQTTETASPPKRGVAFGLGLVVGLAVMAYGVVGLLGAAQATQPRNLGVFFLGAGIVHDAVLAPVVAVVAWLIARAVPARLRPPLWFALAGTALLVVVTWPLVRRWGARAANPSLLPLDYGRNVAVGVAVIWAVALADLARRIVAGRSRR